MAIENLKKTDQVEVATDENASQQPDHSERLYDQIILAELDEMDITYGLPEGAIIYDGRREADPEWQAIERVKALQLMNWVDEAFNEIQALGLDTQGCIDEELRNWGKRLTLILDRQRKRIGIETPLSQADIQKDIREIWWTDHLHKGHRRKGGEHGSYARVHILNTLKNLITKAGVVGRITRTAQLRHDDVEDLPKASKWSGEPRHIEGPEADLMICAPFRSEYESSREEGQMTIKAICKKILRLVLAVTKLKSNKLESKKRHEKAMDATRTLLQAMARGDIRPMGIKAADRIHNLWDIRTHPNAAARFEIGYLSALIYGRLCKVFGMDAMADEIMRASFSEINPGALHRFERLRWSKLEKYIGNSLLERLEAMADHSDIEYIGIHPRKFGDYVDPTEITNLDYTPHVGPIDPMFEIYIQIQQPNTSFQENETRYQTEREAILMRVRDYIVQQTRAPLGQDGRVNTGYTEKEGAWIHVTNQGLFDRDSDPTPLQFVINDGISKARAVRGDLREERTQDPRIARAIREVLEETASDARGLLRALERELLKRKVVVFTPNGEKRELPEGATVVDFMAEVMGKNAQLWHILRDCEGARLVRNPDGDPRTPGRMISPLSEVEHGSCIQILKEEDPLEHYEGEEERHRLDIIWAYFCSKSTRKIVSLALIGLCEKEATIEEKDSIEIESETGKVHLDMVGEMLGFKSNDEFINTLIKDLTQQLEEDIEKHQKWIEKTEEFLRQGGIDEAKKTQREQGISRNQHLIRLKQGSIVRLKQGFIRSIGQGRIERIRTLATEAREATRYDPIVVKFETPDTPGVTQTIAKAFAEHGINIVEMSATTSQAKGNICCKLVPNSDRTSYDIFQALLKLRYNEPGYQIKVESDHFTRQHQVPLFVAQENGRRFILNEAIFA